MNIRVGCDVVYVSSFAQRMQRMPELMQKLFTSHEIVAGYSYASLAGKFAAKEAACKAFGISAGNWQAIEIVIAASGKPELKILFPEIQLSILSCDISISHEGEYAMAICVAITK